MTTDQERSSIGDMDDGQLLAYLLVLAGVRPASAQALSQRLLGAFQTLERVLSQSKETLLRFPGLGENAAVFLLLLPALTARYSDAQHQGVGPAITLSNLGKVLAPHFYGQSTERVYALCLNAQMQLLSGSLAAQGGPASVSCSVSRVLELALTHRAFGVVLAHNHPDGTTSFSKEDLVSTGHISHELSLVEIALLDHYLLAGGQTISLRALAEDPETRRTLPGATPWDPK